jgi:hypothetical protein
VSRTPATIKQADVARAIRAAKKAGASCLDVMMAGTTVRIYLDGIPKAQTDPQGANPWDKVA